jgi:hypothetical protein
LDRSLAPANLDPLLAPVDLDSDCALAPVNSDYSLRAPVNLDPSLALAIAAPDLNCALALARVNWEPAIAATAADLYLVVADLYQALAPVDWEDHVDHVVAPANSNRAFNTLPEMRRHHDTAALVHLELWHPLPSIYLHDVAARKRNDFLFSLFAFGFTSSS